MQTFWLYMLYIPIGLVLIRLWRLWYSKHLSWKPVLSFVILVGTPLVMFSCHLAYFLTKGVPPAVWQGFFLTLDGWKTGYASLGLPFGAVLTVYLASVVHRLPPLELLDLYSPGAFATSIIWRIDCFIDGCCYGAPTSLPWGVRFMLIEGPVITTPPSHPVQLYEAALSFAVLIALPLFIYRKGINPGTGIVVAMCMFLYATERFILEFFRIGGTTRIAILGMSSTQLVTLTVSIITAVLTVFLIKRHPNS